MLNAIKKGDRIVTQGGVFATIVNVNSDSYEVKINEDTKIKIRKSAVAEVLTSEPGAATPEAITAGK
jgi:preprotein translocase subunit YajC